MAQASPLPLPPPPSAIGKAQVSWTDAALKSGEDSSYPLSQLNEAPLEWASSLDPASTQLTQELQGKSFTEIVSSRAYNVNYHYSLHFSGQHSFAGSNMPYVRVTLGVSDDGTPPLQLYANKASAGSTRMASYNFTLDLPQTQQVPSEMTIRPGQDGPGLAPDVKNVVVEVTLIVNVSRAGQTQREPIVQAVSRLDDFDYYGGRLRYPSCRYEGDCAAGEVCAGGTCVDSFEGYTGDGVALVGGGESDLRYPGPDPNDVDLRELLSHIGVLDNAFRSPGSALVKLALLYRILQRFDNFSYRLGPQFVLPRQGLISMMRYYKFRSGNYALHIHAQGDPYGGRSWRRFIAVSRLLGTNSRDIDVCDFKQYGPEYYVSMLSDRLPLQ